MESEKKTLTKEQTVKKRVCEVCEYEYVLLKACDSSREMAEQILEVLKRKHVYVFMVYFLDELIRAETY